MTAASKGKGEAGINSAGTAGYISCALPDIQRALSRLFADLQGAGDSYTRAASTNVLIPVGSGLAAERCEDLIEELARLHPSRFFIVEFDPGVEKLLSHVTARCHLMGRSPEGKAQHVCSEVVRLTAPPSGARALAEALRANLVIGTPTELVLFDAGIEEKLLAVTLPLCEHLFLDSSMLVASKNLLSTASHSNLHTVDLQWIALGVWRDQIKAAFDGRATLGLARGLERIEITSQAAASDGGPGEIPLASLLLAGWFASRLGLEVSSAARTPAASPESAPVSQYVFNCSSPAGSTVRVVLTMSAEAKTASSGAAVSSPLCFGAPRWFGAEDSPEPKLQSVSLQGIVRGGKPASVRLECRERSLEATVKAGEGTLVLSRPLEEQGALARLKRYFLIGESTINYASALTQALHFYRQVSQTK